VTAEIVVSAPARLHLGMLDPAGLGSRRFGGFGVAVEAPRVVVAVRRSDPGEDPSVVATGPQADRARKFAERARDQFGVDGRLSVVVREAIPPHVGLGSGTKLGLAVARAVAELGGVAASPSRLAAATGRGARSSIGTWTFAEPGLVVEAGVVDDGALSPLIVRAAMPDRWRCVLAVPAGAEGLSGNAEERFFGELARVGSPEPPVARLLLTSLLPGLQVADINEFGAALSEIQVAIGSIFAAQQGGVFHPSAAPLVSELRRLGVRAVGQSSWGPAVYGIVEDPGRAESVAAALRTGPGADAHIRVVDFDRHGVLVEPSAELV